jgi:hypothetical protein
MRHPHDEGFLGNESAAPRATKRRLATSLRESATFALHVFDDIVHRANGDRDIARSSRWS